MSDQEEIDDTDQTAENYIFTKQERKSTSTEMEQEEDNEPRVHFEVFESKDGEQYRIIQKPSRPRISVASKTHSLKNRRSSTIWNTFTIRDSFKSIASCNICGMRLSYKSTVSNLRNHLRRKHNRDSIPRALNSKCQVSSGLTYFCVKSPAVLPYL